MIGLSFVSDNIPLKPRGEAELMRSLKLLVVGRDEGIVEAESSHPEAQAHAGSSELVDAV